MVRSLIEFLGTARACVVVSNWRQFRALGEISLSLQDVNIVMDPGPGSLIKCLSSSPRLDPTKLDAIILSHRHLDHAADVQVMVEAVTQGGFEKRAILFTFQGCDFFPTR